MKRRRTDALQESPLAGSDQQFYGIRESAPSVMPSRRGTCPGCGGSGGSKRNRLCEKCKTAGVQAPPPYSKRETLMGEADS